MKYRSAFVLAAVAASLVGGCAGSRTDLVSTGVVSLETAVNRPLSHDPVVERADGDLVVRGKLDDDEAVAGGHLDITVTSPDGAVVHDVVVNYGRASSSHTTQLGPRGASRRVPTGPKHAEYAVRFPGLPPAGSVVRVRVDSAPHKAPFTRK